MKKLQMTSSTRELIIFPKSWQGLKARKNKVIYCNIKRKSRRVRHYRSMELDIQEKVVRDREGREAKSAAKKALASTNASIEPSSDTGKGKSPMEEVPQTSLEKQFKAYLYTSK